METDTVDPELLLLPQDSVSEGLDLQAAQTWIYPTNYPVRDYQYNIVEKALHKNTLVSLPTGLGKTFIAAVVMYNFYRWFPLGKVIFMAPTRPLVRQQVDACYDIMGIPKEVTAELTGSKLSASREEIWKEKRVFFITPQILQNDLDKISWLGQKIKCVVLDEAHKARGNHAYCEVIKKLRDLSFRVLALSATPGASINDCLEIIQNLLISHLEFRTEESPDVKPYIFERNLTTAVVPLDEKLQQVKDDYLKILDVYTRILMQYKVLQGSYGNITKGKIFITLNNFRQKSKSHPKYNEIMKNLNICITLYHAYELLIRHGLRSFHNFFEEHVNKPLLRDKAQILEIMEDIRQHLGPPLKMELLPDGNYTEVPKDIKFGHPKFYKLNEILVKHFQEKGDGSKVIVFFEYRESVMEAFALLNQSRPLLKPRVFLGQKNGITQKLQLNVVKSFRDGTCNLLLSTCIGEEGIDVGEVDLIVCFDISNKSPIRMVQRMGRTGRKKEGSIVVLVTEGKEQQTLHDCLIHKNNVTYHVLNSSEISKGLVQYNPDMLAGMVPKCEKIYITVKKVPLQKNGSLKEMFKRVSSNDLDFSPDLDFADVPERLPKSVMLCKEKDPLNSKAEFCGIFSKKITKQRSFQDKYKVQHSKDSEMLVSLLQLSDSKRFNIPTSQVDGTSQKKLKQIDIRKMFGNPQNPQDFIWPVSQASKPESHTSQEDKHITAPKFLFDEISQFLSIYSLAERCKHCPDYVHCEKSITDNSNDKIAWIELEESIFTSVTADDLNAFSLNLMNPEDFQLDVTIESSKPDVPEPTKFDKSLLPLDKSFGFEAPKTFDTLLNRYSTSMVVLDEPFQTQVDRNSNRVKNREDELSQILKFFKLDSLSDMFGDKKCDSPTPMSQKTDIYSPDLFDESNSPKMIRRNFITSPVLVKRANLQSVRRNIDQMDSQDLPSSNTTIINISLTSPVLNKNPKPQMDPNFALNSTRIGSPLLTSHSQSSTGSTSPILSKGPGALKAKQNVCEVNSFSRANKPNLFEDLKDFCDMSVFEFDSSKRETVSKQVQKEALKDLCDKSILEFDSSKKEAVSKQVQKEALKDFCDMSILEFDSPKNETVSKQVQKKDLKDFCDKSIFECDSSKKETVSKQVQKKDLEDFCDTSIFEFDSPKKATVSKNVKKGAVNDVDFGEIEDICDISLLKDFKKFYSRVEQKKESPVMNRKRNFTGFIDEYGESICREGEGEKSPILNKRMDVDAVDKSPVLNKSLITSHSQHENQGTDSLQNPTPSMLSITAMLSYIGKSTDNTLLPSTSKKNPHQENFLIPTSPSLKRKTPSSPSISVSSRRRNVISPSPNMHDFTFNNKKIPKKRLFGDTSPSTEVKAAKVPEKQMCDSDDDFEPRPIISPAKFKNNAQQKKVLNKKTDRDSKKRNKKPSEALEFIEKEADVSLEKSIVISDDEDEENLDRYDKSFVEDDTVITNTQVHANYLHSTRSPILNRGQFKIPAQTSARCIDVFSQEFQQDETYLNDTFVVDEETEVSESLSELEILELELERKRKSKKKKQPLKRKRIILISSDDSE